MAFSHVGGKSKVSAMVKDSKCSATVSKSGGSNFVYNGNLGNDGQGSAKGVHDDHEYDSSSSPSVLSPHGEDDSIMGRKMMRRRKSHLQ